MTGAFPEILPPISRYLYTFGVVTRQVVCHTLPRVAKSLKNSTDTTLILKNLHQKCMQKMRKKCKKLCKSAQNCAKNCVKPQQISTAGKN